ncbi:MULTISPECIES: helix-turn-helix transcriptional regulator [Cryobacterium]|uniref:XRE family transcriptional regulator n=1 Tax=Cryobacterium breve TaxID=1259258 RepID=A0ABY2J1G0_9MICO|nr:MULTISPECIES: helix-turn-helix transcriptional regulator [Cryobacterium]TFC94095.1 XRE family transcriptional regulator [Cryobacterium sp. TmT3-12]TFC98674.1 XRE family transcriptional regulator [Cryobacterium breve]
MTSELGSVLRGWRNRVSPAAVGMPGGAGRRTSGLRREELATLAGLSVDYIVRLEQGRARAPSAPVLGSLARALRLTHDERDHLYRVAGAVVPTDRDLPRHITPSLQRNVDRLSDTPASVYSAAWDIVAWNPLWAALLGDPSTLAPRNRNLVRLLFAEGEAPIVRDAASRLVFARDIAADLRIAFGRYLDDSRLARLVDDLRSSNSEFAALRTETAVSRHVAERKTIASALVGTITLDCDVLTVPGSDLRLVIYTAEPGSADAGKLDVLRVAGLQTFATAAQAC